MADEIEKLRQSLDNLTAQLKSGGGRGGAPSSIPTKPTEEEDKKKKVATVFGALAGHMKGFAVGLLSVGTVLKGLSGTREGHQLDYVFNHLFYEIADAFRGPIRFITNELEGFARIMHKFNAQGPEHHLFSADEPAGTPQHHVFGPDDPGYMQHRLFGPDHEAGTPEHHLFGPDDPGYQDPHPWFGPDLPDKNDPRFARVPQAIIDRQRREGKIGPDGKPASDDHLQPILHTTFSDVAGLQQRMQALSTENPAQERGLSLIEQVYNILVKIYNKLPGFGSMEEIPDPMIKKD